MYLEAFRNLEELVPRQDFFAATPVVGDGSKSDDFLMLKIYAAREAEDQEFFTLHSLVFTSYTALEGSYQSMRLHIQHFHHADLGAFHVEVFLRKTTGVEDSVIYCADDENIRGDATITMGTPDNLPRVAARLFPDGWEEHLALSVEQWENLNDRAYVVQSMVGREETVIHQIETILQTALSLSTSVIQKGLLLPYSTAANYWYPS